MMYQIDYERKQFKCNYIVVMRVLLFFSDALLCVDIFSPVHNIWNQSSPLMTLVYCQHLCKGQTKQYSLVKGDTCYCTTNLPNGTVIREYDWCDTSCPGNKFQACGSLMYNSFTLING